MLTKEQRAELTALTTAGQTRVRAMKRAMILLKADEGPDGPAWADQRIADALDVSLGTVSNSRYAANVTGCNWRNAPRAD
jgi:hypothetical protein